MNWMASKWLRCIFQLPEMSGLRPAGAPPLSVPRSAIRARPFPGVGGVAQGLEAGQVAELEELEAGAPARRDVIDLVGQAEAGQRGGGVATPHDGEGVGGRHGFG